MPPQKEIISAIPRLPLAKSIRESAPRLEARGPGVARGAMGRWCPSIRTSGLMSVSSASSVDQAPN